MIATFEEEIEEGNLNTVMNYEDEPEEFTRIDGEDYTYRIKWSSDITFTTLNKMFYDCSQLIYLDASNFDSSQVTDMS